MKMDSKLNKLLSAARQAPAPAPSEDFDAKVMQAVRRENAPEPLTLFGQLDVWFPRVAFGAVLVIGLCLAAEFASEALGQTDLTSGVAQLSEEWLFTAKGF